MVVCLVISFGLFIVGWSTHDISDVYGHFAENTFNFLGKIIITIPLGKEGFSGGESLMISIIYSFLVGGIIGWSFGKIKNRKKLGVESYKL